MLSTSSQLRRGALALAVVAVAFAATWALAAPRAHAEARVTNPYAGEYGSPNCTWYAWQRLHDTRHIDLQFSANAGDWADRAQQPNAAWDEAAGAFVVPQVTTTPAVGDILVLPVESRYARPYHVAFVEEVYANGSFLVSQQSYGDYSPGLGTSPYPYVRHGTWRLDDVQREEQDRARFLHFPASTPAPMSSVDDAAVVRADPSASAKIDQQFDVSITLKNTGQTTWEDASGYLLACISPDCLGAATVDMGGQQVAPGQQHTFTAHLTAPHDLATVDTKWAMEHNGAIFGPAIPMQIVVGPSTNDWAELVSQQVPSSVGAGQQFSAVFVVRNAGRSTWEPQNGYGLTCVATCMGPKNVQLPAAAVRPGEQTAFTVANLAAPQARGTYTAVWQMTTSKGAFGPQFSATITVPTGWVSWYQVQRPSCDDAQAWSDTNQTATRDCTQSSGLALSRASDTKWAELDLSAPNGQQHYNQTRFRVRTQAAFLNAGDSSVWAALVVQTPPDGTCGGVLFAVNAQGFWALQQRSSACDISTITSGQVALDPQGFTMQVAVQDGQLAAAIDDQQVASGISVAPTPAPGTVGLMEESPQATASAILYSDFAIDQWSSQGAI